MKQTFVIALILLIGIVSGCKNNNTLNSKNMSELPKFKYQPNALELGIIEKKNIDCPVCRKNRDYAYSDGIYAVEEVEFICPWCIADGSAAEKYDGMYIDDASCQEVSDQNKLTELVTKTPNYVSWQQEVWLAHHDDYCSFEKYVGWKEIEHLKENLSDDIERIKSEYGLSQSEFEQYLVNDGGMQGYLFKCLHCDQHRLHIDTN